MNVVLIPFLLATNVSLNSTTESWSKGVDKIFKLEIIIATTTTGVSNKDEAFERHTSMRCRDTDVNIMTCYVVNENQTFSDLMKPFDVVFNETGVESLRIQEPVPAATLKLLKKIVGQFNFGLDPYQFIDTNTVKGKELTVVGPCDTMFSLSREPDYDNYGEDNKLESIVFAFDLKNTTGMMLQKYREPKTCPKLDKLFYYVQTEPVGLPVRAERYTGHVQMDKQHPFRSTTTARARYPSPDKKSITVVTEIITVEFMRLDKMIEDFPSSNYNFTTSYIYD